jgi:HSP20 family molecular chaperone IbpA
MENIDSMIKRLIEMMQSQMANFGEPTEIKPGDAPKVNKYTISYNFNTKMDKPEIKVKANGKILESEELEDFLQNMELLDFQPDQLPIEDSLKLEPLNNIIEPFTDVIKEANQTIIILEMPGIQAEDITIDQEFNDQGINTIRIIAERDNRRYEKMIKFNHKLAEKPAIHTNNGIFTLTFDNQ